jgi:MFS family permease
MEKKSSMSKKNLGIVTGALLLSNIMAGLDGTIINTALPAIISDLHGIQYMGWIVAVFLLGMAVSTPLWSKVGEKIGKRHTYQIATALFAIGAVFQALSGNIIFFLVARAFMGIGAGGMNTLPFIIYADLYQDLKRRGRVIGYATASFSAASIVGPLVGGWIVDTFSWHWVFYINVPIALISILATQFFFKETVSTKETKPVDYLGASLLIISLVTLLTGIQLIGTSSTLVVAALIVIGLVLLVALFKAEQKAQDPIIPNRLFKNHLLIVDFSLFAILWGAFVAFNIYIPMWAQGLLALSALLGGMTQIPGAFTNFAGSMTGPAIQPAVGKFRVVLFGTIGFLIAFIGMIFATKTTPYWYLLLMGAFEGFGLGMCFNVLQISVQEDAELRDISIATSFAYLLRILSQTFMSSIYGVVLNHAISNGVAASHGTITIGMMNKLSDSKAVGQLPKKMIPAMQDILFTGLHHIMMLATCLLIVAFVLIVTILVKTTRKPSASTN